MLLGLLSTFPVVLSLLFIFRNLSEYWVKWVSFFYTAFVFCVSLYLWITLPLTNNFYIVNCLNWFDFYPICFGLDNISVFFIILTTFITLLCVVSAFSSVKKNLQDYLILLLLIEMILISVFTILDFFVFYLLFETILIPMFLLVGFWGSGNRRMKAAYYLFIYTLFGSLFLLLSLLVLALQQGSFNWFVLLYEPITTTRELLLWPGIFLSFAIKIPMYPFHIWLPEAHVEAPTGGSIILASLLLKLGTFGFIRYLFPLFPLATTYYSSLVSIIALVSVLYSSLVALRQIDLKRIIAYSSIAHMNFGLLGLFSGTFDGVLGGMYIMLGHGLISGALFYLIGVIYDRYKTRICFYYGGLAMRMPLFSFFFFFFTVANVGFPGTANFVAEILILFGISLSNLTLCFFSSLSFFLTTVFSFWLLNRVIFGTLRTTRSTQYFFDLQRAEYWVLCWLAVFTLFFGLWPSAVLDYLVKPLLNVIISI